MACEGRGFQATAIMMTSDKGPQKRLEIEREDVL
jgi:hypothetical protein